MPYGSARRRSRLSGSIQNELIKYFCAGGASTSIAVYVAETMGDGAEMEPTDAEGFIMLKFHTMKRE